MVMRHIFVVFCILLLIHIGLLMYLPQSLAKEIVRSKRTVNRLYENKAQLNSISMHLGESVGMIVVLLHFLYVCLSSFYIQECAFGPLKLLDEQAVRRTVCNHWEHSLIKIAKVNIEIIKNTCIMPLIIYRKRDWTSIENIAYNIWSVKMHNMYFIIYIDVENAEAGLYSFLYFWFSK